MLKLKLQYSGHWMGRADSLEKTDAGKDRGQEKKVATEDEMVGWHHWLIIDKSLSKLWMIVKDREAWHPWGPRVQQDFSSVSQTCLTLSEPMDCGIPGRPVHHQLPEFTQTHVHWVGDTIQPSHPLLSPSPPTFNLPQHQGLFKWVSSLHQVADALEFQLQHHPSNEYSGLISFRMDWLDLLAVQGTLKSLLQHHSLKASILGAQLSL